MYVEIEIISEKILDLLDDKGRLNAHEIRKTINEPEEYITRSLQWLTQTEFITEDLSTGEYAVSDIQKGSPSPSMMARESSSKN